MRRRDLSRALFTVAAGSALLANRAESQTCTAPCYVRTAAEIGAGVTPTNYEFEPLDVRRYGAIGDGVNDDTLAFQNAINVCQQEGIGQFVRVPGANPSTAYKITAPLLITKPCRVVGDNMWVTVRAVGLAAGQYVVDIDGTVAPDLHQVVIENLSFMSDNNAPNLFRINRASNCLFRSIGIRNCVHAFIITGNNAFSNEFDRVVSLGAISGSCVRWTTYTGGGNFTFQHCDFTGGNGLVVMPDSEVTGIVCNSCNFEACAVDAVYSGGKLYGLTLSGCRFEANASGGFDINLNPNAGNVCYGFAAIGCNFYTNSALQAINLGGAGGQVRGFTIAGSYAQGYSAGFVRLNGDGESGLIIGTRLSNAVPVVNTVRSGVMVINNENSGGAIGPKWNPPQTVPTYTRNPTVVESRSLLASASATAVNCNNVLAALIKDLQDVGIIK